MLAAVLLTGGCATGNAGTTAPSPAPSGSLAVATGRPVRPEPSFADLTRGSTVSAVKLFAYEPAARSAVVEPIIFMGGAAYCKTYQVKRTDTRCQEEWTTEKSRRKVTMTVAAKPALLTWQGEDGDVCAESLADGSGGTCPISAPESRTAWRSASTLLPVRPNVRETTTSRTTLSAEDVQAEGRTWNWVSDYPTWADRSNRPSSSRSRGPRRISVMPPSGRGRG
ncbi:hypothetical protein AB0M54_40135 [Actinoplanes sp. NPDC051470]|uniref:hypothetical protein n=1 Tax=Actinoplanes sp. NPDC051470 TaxID=3157224 RepID=UPI00341D8737